VLSCVLLLLLRFFIFIKRHIWWVRYVIVNNYPKLICKK